MASMFASRICVPRISCSLCAAFAVRHCMPRLPSTHGSRRSMSRAKSYGNAVAHKPQSPPPPPSPSPSPSSSPPRSPSLDQPFPAPYQHELAPPRPRSPLTKWITASPRRTALLLKIGDWLGYGSPKQLAANRSRVLYDICSQVATGPERAFWYDALSLPPSFQSWFTITNLHVWLMTVRLRALPSPHGLPFVQGLIDHFFLDVEDRVRAVLGKKAPERLVTQQMKILREQWGGLGLSFDHALIVGDKEMASAVWRNLLGARGASGIAYPEPDSPSGNASNSPSDSEKNLPKKVEEAGGVVDFEGRQVDKYVLYPQLMLAIVGYVRRELVRLEEVSDADILGNVEHGMQGSVLGEGGSVTTMDLRDVVKFGRVRDAARKLGIDTGLF